VIGTLVELVHGLPGTTFSNVMQRGRYDSDKAACLTPAELERWLTVAIAKFHQLRPHAGLKGEAPPRRYQAGVRALAAEGRAPPTPRNPRAFVIDFLPVVRRTLRRDGLVIDHIHYFSDALKPWIETAREPRRVLIRRDPRDLRLRNKPRFDAIETTGAGIGQESAGVPYKPIYLPLAYKLYSAYVFGRGRHARC
jgi:putative transposase